MFITINYLLFSNSLSFSFVEFSLRSYFLIYLDYFISAKQQTTCFKTATVLPEPNGQTAVKGSE